MQPRTLSVLLLVGIVAAPSDAAAPPKTADASQIARFVAQLGDDEFAVRERAEHTLLAIGPPAVPALVKALSDADPEIRRRALAIATAIEKRTEAFFEALGADVQRDNVTRHVKIISYQGRDPSRLRDEHLRMLVGLPWLKRVCLYDNPIGDKGLAYLGGLKALDYLVLEGTKVTDAGLPQISGLAEVEHLYLYNTSVTGRGLASLQGMKKLKYLQLSWTQVSDAGLAGGMSGIKRIKSLKYLQLGHTRVTDESLSCLKEITVPIGVGLGATRVTDRGLAKLRGMPNLVSLDLDETAVTDVGCSILAQMKRLKGVSLSDTRVTAAGLLKLKVLPRLQQLRFRGIKLSEKEKEELRAAMPRRVMLDGTNLAGRGEASEEP